MENSILIQNIAAEYQKGKSAKEVGDIFGIKEKKVRYWMKKAGIKARSRSEATYCKRNPDGDPFIIPKQITNPDLLALFFLAIGLYLGEGDKKVKHRVALANTNPAILRIFINFLTVICGVKTSKIAAELNIFDDVSTSKALNYWAKELGLNPSQFARPIIRKSKPTGTYKNKSIYGTLNIRVNNTKLKTIILKWCDHALAQSFSS